MDHPHDLRTTDSATRPRSGDEAEQGSADRSTGSGVPVPPGTRRRGDRSAVTAALLALAAVAVVAAAMGVRGVTEDPAPRQLRVDAPSAEDPAAAASSSPIEGAAARVDADDVREVTELARRVLDPSLPPAERAALVEEGGPGRPTAVAVFESFDGLAASVGAHLADATFSVDALSEDVVRVMADIPMQSDLGSSARLRDLLVRRDGDGWRMTYESLCGLANLAPLMGGTSACPGNSALHHDTTVPDLATLLVGSAPAIERVAPIGVADGYSASVRTGRWAWLVDYPEAELGGGAPSTPAELVRVDADTGEESGRLRLVGTQPVMASDGDDLWLLQYPFDESGAWLDPHLARVDPESLRILSDTTVPGASSVQASGGVAWAIADDGVHRFRAAEDTIVEDVRPWNGEAVSTVDEYQLSTAATPEGLWILPSYAPGATGGVTEGVLVDAATMEMRPISLPASSLTTSGGQLWAQDTADPSLLRRLAADGSVLATMSSPVRSGGQIWGDGRGGLWVVGDALPLEDCCQMVDYAVTRRAMAVHLDAAGDVDGTWWSTGTVPNGPDWFTKVGDGLGWSGLEGIELLAP